MSYSKKYAAASQHYAAVRLSRNKPSKPPRGRLKVIASIAGKQVVKQSVKVPMLAAGVALAGFLTRMF